MVRRKFYTLLRRYFVCILCEENLGGVRVYAAAQCATLVENDASGPDFVLGSINYQCRAGIMETLCA